MSDYIRITDRKIELTDEGVEELIADYTPTTEEVRNRFTFHASGIRHPEFEEQFDRWLAEVKAEAWEEGWVSCFHAYWHKEENPYRKET